jgi:hypothetical protein
MLQCILNDDSHIELIPFYFKCLIITVINLPKLYGLKIELSQIHKALNKLVDLIESDNTWKIVFSNKKKT